MNPNPVEMKPPFSNYVIYPDGKVWSKISKRYIATFINNSGYQVVRLWENNTEHKFLVHRLVAEYFVHKPFWCDVVNHKDGNRLNNVYSNLEWCTQQQNLFAAQLQGKMHDRIQHPYCIKNMSTGEEYICMTLKQCFSIFGLDTCYCYHSRKMGRFWKTHPETEPYQFKHYVISRVTDINFSDIY